MHSTTVSIPHKELHPIKDTGVFKTSSWMEETWVTNHTVVLTTYHRTDVPILVNVSMRRLCGKLRKWDGSEWSWFRLSWLIFATLWRLNAQRGTPASECHCVIGVLSASVPVWWCWDGGSRPRSITLWKILGQRITLWDVPTPWISRLDRDSRPRTRLKHGRSVRFTRRQKKLRRLDENTNHWIGLKFLDQATISVEGSFKCPKTYSEVYIPYLLGEKISFKYGG